MVEREPAAHGPTARMTGVSEHTDYELITLMWQSAPGLELRDRRGRWRALGALRDSLVVICGDMLERLSGGYFEATKHRVALNAKATPRRSLVFFQGAFCLISHSQLNSYPHIGTTPSFPHVPPRCLFLYLSFFTYILS